MKNAQIFTKVFSAAEIASLIEYYSSLPYVKDKYINENVLQFRNKHNHYDLKNSVPYSIMYDKIAALIGQHAMEYGDYLESHYPFSLHVDTNYTFTAESYYRHDTGQHRNMAVLVPLSEHELFNTVFFDHWSSTQMTRETVLPKITTEPQQHNIDLSHIGSGMRQQLEWIPLDKIFQWKLGDVAVWDRNQLHCASNFLPTGTSKQAIVIFV